uniref:IST1 homolog n=1 Tax=Xenopus laevis TaxID=8355 RepID=Q6DCY0_XENLA|nr:MGC80567 protein [Xenopus laevis]
MLGSGFKAERLRVNLRLAINRLKLLEKKKTEMAQKARKEIADYLSCRKDERARIRVEHIIREDYLVEAMEILELYCDLLLARYGLIQSMRELDPGLAEAVSTLIWAAPRLQSEVSELKIVSCLNTVYCQAKSPLTKNITLKYHGATNTFGSLLR